MKVRITNPTVAKNMEVSPEEVLEVEPNYDDWCDDDGRKYDYSYFHRTPFSSQPTAYETWYFFKEDVMLVGCSDQ